MKNSAQTNAPYRESSVHFPAMAEQSKTFEQLRQSVEELYRDWLEIKERELEIARKGFLADADEGPEDVLREVAEECDRVQQMIFDEEHRLELTENIQEEEDLEAMRAEWTELARKGVPRDQWPLRADLRWMDQFAVMDAVERIVRAGGDPMDPRQRG